MKHMNQTRAVKLYNRLRPFLLYCNCCGSMSWSPRGSSKRRSANKATAKTPTLPQFLTHYSIKVV